MPGQEKFPESPSLNNFLDTIEHKQLRVCFPKSLQITKISIFPINGADAQYPQSDVLSYCQINFHAVLSAQHPADQRLLSDKSWDQKNGGVQRWRQLQGPRAKIRPGCPPDYPIAPNTCCASHLISTSHYHKVRSADKVDLASAAPSRKILRQMSITL